MTGKPEVTEDDKQTFFAGEAERNRHYARQSGRVARWERTIDRKMRANRPSLRHSTDAPGLWK